MRLVRKWSPLGYDRAVALFQRRFYDHSHFFRTVHGFLVQFGISYTADEDLRHFASHPILDDPQLDPPIPFEEGTVSYAGSGPNSRDSQLFIAYDAIDSFGEELWETPIGTVIEGMENVKQFYDNYGDMPPWGNGPEQWRIEEEGINYMEKNYPRMDKFTTCTVNLVNPDTSNSQHFNRELLSKDSINMAQIQYKPKPHELKLSTQGNDNPIAASQPKDLSSFLSESILVKLIGIPLVVIMIFLFSQKKKRTDKKN